MYISSCVFAKLNAETTVVRVRGKRRQITALRDSSSSSSSSQRATDGYGVGIARLRQSPVRREIRCTLNRTVTLTLERLNIVKQRTVGRCRLCHVTWNRFSSSSTERLHLCLTSTPDSRSGERWLTVREFQRGDATRRDAGDISR